MSEGLLHKNLKKVAMVKLYRMGCSFVTDEVYTHHSIGHIDAFGVGRIDYSNKLKTIGIEVKVSRNDFFGRKQKKVDYYLNSGFYGTEVAGMNEMYFLVPKGLIGAGEVYKGWGLLEWDGRRITRAKEPTVYEDVDHVMTLYWMVSRLHNWEGRNITYKDIFSKPTNTKENNE